MKKFKKLIIGSLLSVSLFGFQSNADAASNYQVKSGDTFWKVATRYGVTINSLKAANHRTSNMLYAGESIVVPTSSVSDADKTLMARLVHAEASGESYAGKVAVATVILNRVDNPNFPNTIRGVIYQVDGGYYAFTPVQNGRINNTPSVEARKAVNEAITLRGTGKGSLYFYNPKTTTSKWILSRPVTTIIGNHRFAR